LLGSEVCGETRSSRCFCIVVGLIVTDGTCLDVATSC
jgi:hypothetical protein